MRKENMINPTMTLEASHLCLIGTISMGHSDNPNDSLGLFLTGYRDYSNAPYKGGYKLNLKEKINKKEKAKR